MDATKKRIDKVLSESTERVQEEIGALLGVELTVTPIDSVVQTKEEIFDNLKGKQVFAHVDYSGDIEGVGGLILGLKGAIRLGGTLIMLPPAELDEVVGREEYSEELDDSYGEIANIIAGSYTKVFEEMYPKKFRFIRKELEILQPINIEPDSDEPIPDQPYYSVGCTLTLGKVDLGPMYMLMPAVAFGLVEHVEAQPETQEEAPVQAETAEVQPEAESDEQETPDEPVAEQKKPIDKAKHLKRVQKILAECGDRLTEEVSALLGAQVSFEEFETTYISKEDFFFEEVDGKQVMAHLDVTGDNPGNSYLYFGLKGAIHLGGTLIMLPPAELDNTCSAEDFTEDITDAYGEIANIITGAISLVFEEQYPEQIRFIKTDIAQVVPMKVDTDSDEPIPNQQYFMMSLAATADGKELGKLRLLFPDYVLHLELEEEHPAQPELQKAAASVPARGEAPQQEPVSETAGTEDEQDESTLAIDPDFDLDKQKKRVDRILEECRSRTQAEVGELLGAEIQLDDLDNRPVSKEDFFFDELSGKQVLANMDVVGDVEGKSYLFVSLKDAIHTGGVLIMLPSAELENTVAEEEFNDDVGDAYGEIANIISGVYTAVFEEQYVQSLRFIKTDLALVVPMKVDPESEEPIPDQPYYMSGMSLTIGGEKKGKVHMLFPAELLKLEMLGREEELAEAQAAAIRKKESADAGGATETTAPQEPVSGQAAASTAGGVAPPAAPAAAPISYEPADVLIISDADSEASQLAAGAGTKGFRVRRIGYNDDIRSALTGELKIVYLVMREVNEQAFGIAINVRASSNLPIVAAGPGWTRSKVIKAVKYGVSDILLTPATAEDVDENITNNLTKMAA
ncbi:hypothetical protein [Desulfopila sp. IMCC35008]|uniref:hypothetical protein n=1 Tax=Desulfopila sp. IMCC35008 TaxID=2653858 RepID=UPI0013D2378E|nr:hypothetical protein [Desulfopila sp. IMCC35008]